MNPLHNAARTVLMDCMALKNGESVLVVTDPLRRGIGEALREVAAAVAGEVMYMEMNARDVNGAEPPAAVATAMCQVDVVICPTTTSLTHTKARRDACAAGARVGTMPGITEEIMIRTMQARLTGHHLFSGTAAERLKMCADCRIVDMATHEQDAGLVGLGEAVRSQRSPH